MANIETSTDASRVIYLNSADATQRISNLEATPTGGINYRGDKTTDVRFFLEEAISVPAHHTILLSLHSCNIPYTFYNFQLGGNTQLQFYISDYNSRTTNRSPASGYNTITIRAGNYTPTTLATELKTQLNAQATIGGDFDCEYDAQTLKYKYVFKKSGKRLTFNFDNEDRTFRNAIGFNDNNFVQGITDPEFFIEEESGGSETQRMGWTTASAEFVINSQTNAVASHDDPMGDVSEYFSVVDVNYNVRSLYLRTNITQHSVLDSAINNRFSNILARIPLNAESGGEITITPSDGSIHTLMLKVREITEILVRLTDKDNRVINLHGLDFTMTPEVRIPVGMREKVEARKIHKFLKNTGKERELKQFLEEDQNKKFLNV